MSAKDDSSRFGEDALPRDLGSDSQEASRIELELPDGVGSASDDVSQLQVSLQAAEDRVLRAQAELENYRRRVRREMDDERKFANQSLLTDLLSVADNIDRAIEAANKASDASGLLTGFQMVGQQLSEIFTKHHCTRIEAADQPFDPELHQAIAQQPADDLPAGTVVHVAQEGYVLHGRVIRPAQVIVSKKAE